MSASVLAMKPVGEVADAWRRSNAFIAAIMGPVGSGKTSTGVAKCFQIAMKQRPMVDTRTGVKWRRARIGVIRDTYPNLDSTVLATWHAWVPRDVGRYTHDAPRRHLVQLKVADDEMVQLEMVFIAIGDKRVEDVLRGLELTAAWINEADRVAQDVLAYLRGRIGRYPGAKLGGCVDPQIFIDLNAFDTDNYLYPLLVERDSAGIGHNGGPPLDEDADTALPQNRAVIEFFVQPPAILENNTVNPAAENLANLPPGYYAMQIQGNSKDYVDRMLRNKLVPPRHGQPVYPEFDFQDHVSRAPIDADKGRKIIVGLDAGLTPAAVFVQRNSLGDLRVLGELVVFADGDEMLGKVGATRFGQALKQYVAESFAGFELDYYCDPAAKDGTDSSGNEKSWLQIVAGEIGKRIRPAKTNRLHIRLEAVRRPMMRRGGFLMDPRCKILRKGFIAGYHYRKVAIGDGTGRFEHEPNKNMFSHVQDALQYACMSDGEVIAEILGKDRRKSRRDKPRVNHGKGYFSGGLR